VISKTHKTEADSVLNGGKADRKKQQQQQQQSKRKQMKRRRREKTFSATEMFRLQFFHKREKTNK
jgi:hypothetical protein